MERIYIFGPMSGLPDLNYPAFRAEAKKLREIGYHVEDPSENPDPPCGSWKKYMEMAVKQLVTCDRVHGLPGWSKSRGGRVEYVLAKGLGLDITFQNEAAADESIE